MCARFGWLPSQAENEDWATLAEIQDRIVREDAQVEYEQWQQKVKATW